MFSCPRSRLRIWSRETSSAFPSRVSLPNLHTQAKSWCCCGQMGKLILSPVSPAPEELLYLLCHTRYLLYFYRYCITYFFDQIAENHNGFTVRSTRPSRGDLQQQVNDLLLGHRLSQSMMDQPDKNSIAVATNSRSMIFVTIVTCVRWCVCVCLIPYIMAPVYAFRCMFDVSAGV